MDSETREAFEREFRDKVHLSQQFKVRPYEEVKKNLDRAVAETAKQTAAEIVKLFEPLGTWNEQ